ncbi:hypothetical protein Tco_1269846, partial [Tanacetum coccineum]
LVPEPKFWIVCLQDENSLLLKASSKNLEQRVMQELEKRLDECEESMPVYDNNIEDLIEEEEGFIRKGGFGGEEDNIEKNVVVA